MYLQRIDMAPTLFLIVPLSPGINGQIIFAALYYGFSAMLFIQDVLRNCGNGFLPRFQLVSLALLLFLPTMVFR